MGFRDKARQFRDKFLERAEKIVGKNKLYEKFELSNFIIELFNDVEMESQIQTVLFGLISKFNVNKIIINFLNETNNIYEPIGYKGIEEATVPRFKFEFDSYFIKAIHTPIKIDELLKEPDYKDEIDIFNSQGIKVLFPLFYGGDVKGFIGVGNKTDNSDYVSEDFLEMENLGRIIGTAFSNSYNFYSMEKEYTKLKNENRNYVLLLESFKNINLADNLDEALSIFYRNINDIFKVEIANIVVAKPGDSQYRCIKSWGLSEDINESFTIAKDDEIFKNIAEVGEAMMLPDFQNLEVFNKFNDEDKRKIRFFYTVPIKFGESCVGFFNIFKVEGENNEVIPPNKEKIFSFIPFSLLPYILYKIHIV